MMKRVLALLAVFVMLWVPTLAGADDFEDFDDFDALFDEAEGDVVVEEAPVPVVEEKKEEKADSSLLKITGSISSKVGIAAVFNEDGYNLGGALELSNSMDLNIRPSNLFNVHGSLSTSLAGGFSISGFSTFYFDTLLFDSLYASIGKKSVSWGNMRIYNTNVVGTVSGCEIKYPWSLGTVTAVVSGSDFSSIDWKKLDYAAAGDVTVAGININAFGWFKPVPYTEEKGDPNTVDYLKIKYGLELKRTILGFDVYGQGIVYTGTELEKITAAAGFYRLWDLTPEFGINIEYQYVYVPEPAKNEPVHTHKIGVDMGIKKLGPSRNMKGAVKWRHNFLDESGTVEAAYIINGLIPYGEITSGLKTSYKAGTVPVTTFACGFSFSISY